MATRLNPYLYFDATCREAMEFYQSVLGCELVMLTDRFGTPWMVNIAGDAPQG